VRHPVDLNDQFAIERYEIDDIPIDRMLATELPPRQPTIAKRLL
jgi:hypothetical protein